jgi:four helix bundle protein
MTMRVYDLEERFTVFADDVLSYVDGLPSEPSTNHIARQLIRSGTSPMANYAEADAASSRRDFINKLRICLKELKETERWITLLDRRAKGESASRTKLLDESRQLIRIISKSVKTAESV